MSTDLFAHKIRTLFSRFDMDSNGKIELNDFSAWSQKLISIGNLNNKQVESLTLNIELIWSTYFLPADFDHDGSVQEAELVSYMREAVNDKEKLEAIKETLKLIFDAIDSNQDDGVSSDEFSNYFNSLGVSDDVFANEVFHAMDSNQDGILNKREFEEFGQEFFVGTDATSPSRHFFGPLV